MLTALRDHHATLIRWLDAHRTLCEARSPDFQALRHARWQIAQASRKRLNFLADTVFPFAERHAHLKAAAGLLTLRNETPAYAQLLSAFNARWPMDKVTVDCEGYAREAVAHRREADRRLFAEERHLRMLMTEIAWQPDGMAPMSEISPTAAPPPAGQVPARQA